MDRRYASWFSVRTKITPCSRLALAPPLLHSNCHLSVLSWGEIIGFFPAFFYIYFYVPFLAVYYGLQGFYPAKFDSVKRFPTIEDAMDITFLKLFQQYGEALPQFLLALLYYMNNTYFINNNVKYFDLTLISMFFSGGSVVLGLFSGLATTKITFPSISHYFHIPKIFLNFFPHTAH